MDLQDSFLLKAARLCPADIRTEAGVGVADVLEHLERDDWETALLLLEELGDAHLQSPEFWDLLADTARLLWLHKDAEWYGWRGCEVRSGAVLAELHLMSPEEGGRTRPVPPDVVLRPMWDIGRLTPGGDPLLSIAMLWVEGRDPLEPGECGRVRLLPLTFEHWRHVKPGDVITMHEIRPPAGTARITEIIPPGAAGSWLQFQLRSTVVPRRSRRTGRAYWSRWNRSGQAGSEPLTRFGFTAHPGFKSPSLRRSEALSQNFGRAFLLSEHCRGCGCHPSSGVLGS
ncbi:hypothetical protein [Streptosporangium sp. NPDC003464]